MRRSVKQELLVQIKVQNNNRNSAEEEHMKFETQNQCLLSKTKTVYGQSKYIGLHALAYVVNELKAGGAEEIAVSMRTELPTYAYKSKINGIEKLVKEACNEYGITLIETESIKHGAVNVPAVTVTGIAQTLNEEKEPVKAGMDIVLTKWVGFDGMLQIVEEKEPELKERFAPAFLKQIQNYRSQIFACAEIEKAKEMNAAEIRQVTEGGILAALWNLAKEHETGLKLEMKQIPILQETIEVCEHYRLNPYQLISAGCLLILTADGKGLVEALENMQVAGVVVGQTTDNNDKIIYNGEEVRYIDRPAQDEIFKLFSDTQNI